MMSPNTAIWGGGGRSVKMRGTLSLNVCRLPKVPEQQSTIGLAGETPGTDNSWAVSGGAAMELPKPCRGCERAGAAAAQTPTQLRPGPHNSDRCFFFFFSEKDV